MRWNKKSILEPEKNVAFLAVIYPKKKNNVRELNKKVLGYKPREKVI